MSTVQMHYDGWVTLPAAARQKFGLATGDRLEVEFTGEAIVLRPAQGSAAPERAIAEPAPVATEEPIAAAVPPPVVKRGPGRPRKVPADIALPPNLKTRGRRKAVPAIVEHVR